MSATQQQEIRDLRALNLTAKQIARKLVIKVSEVNAYTRTFTKSTSASQMSRLGSCVTFMGWHHNKPTLATHDYHSSRGYFEYFDWLTKGTLSETITDDLHPI